MEYAKLGASQESQWLEHVLGLEKARQYLTYYSAPIILHLEYLLHLLLCPGQITLRVSPSVLLIPI